MSNFFRVVALIGIVCGGFSCASSEPKSDFELDIDDDEIRVAISKEVAKGVLEGMIGSELECNGDIDGEMRGLLEELKRKGPGSRAAYREGESVVSARRRGSKLDLDIQEAGSGRIRATMPWKIADCMLGSSTTIDKTMASSIKVTVSNHDGRNFSFRLD